jgi:hypothetical protein
MTDVEFSRLLSQLQTTAKTLNEESDTINTTLARYEESIRKTNVGLECCVSLVDGYDDGDHLWWTRVSSAELGWGLAIHRSLPIQEASREDRIAALDALPRLVAKLTVSAQSYIDSIRKAKDLVSTGKEDTPPGRGHQPGVDMPLPGRARQINVNAPGPTIHRG